MISVRFVAVTVALISACSNGGGNGEDASTEGGMDAGKDIKVPSDTGSQQDVDNDNDAGATFLNPECTVPAEAGSGGACVTLTGDGGVECNPVTSAPCNIDAGEACDYEGAGFHCYPPPPPNTAVICGACDDTNGPACAPTGTCVPVDGGGQACARFCCDDTDCGQGHCDKGTGQTVGLCLQ
jgi:hypothetical protein